MLTEPLIQQLQELRLRGMATALEQQLADREAAALRFEERLALMLQHERAERASSRLAQRLRWARLPQAGACVEDLDTRSPRGVDPVTLATVRDLSCIQKRFNVLIVGSCGVGKSFFASALAHAACRADYSVRCYRLPRLAEDLARAHAPQRRSALLRQLAKTEVLLMRAGRLLLRGVTQSEVARKVGVTRTTVSDWNRQVMAGGLEALQRRPRGRPSGLDTQRAELVRLLKDGALAQGCGRRPAVRSDSRGQPVQHRHGSSADHRSAQLALKPSPLIFVRFGELRKAEREHFDLEQRAEWRIASYALARMRCHRRLVATPNTIALPGLLSSGRRLFVRPAGTIPVSLILRFTASGRWRSWRSASPYNPASAQSCGSR